MIFTNCWSCRKTDYWRQNEEKLDKKMRFGRRTDSRLSVWLTVHCQSDWQSTVSLIDSRLSVWLTVDCQSDWQSTVSLIDSRLSVWLTVDCQSDWQSTVSLIDSRRSVWLTVDWQFDWQPVCHIKAKFCPSYFGHKIKYHLKTVNILWASFHLQPVPPKLTWRPSRLTCVPTMIKL